MRGAGRIGGGGRGRAASAVRDEVAHLSEADGGSPEARARLAASADGLAEATTAVEAAGAKEERVREAVQYLRAALREPEGALADLGG
jgi:hypothetical protein